MMSDRELLEFAAKAVGFAWVDGHVSTGLRDRDGWVWNPWDDDGDAFRLAVRLELFHRLNTVYQPLATIYLDATDPDPYAATRRAIVRAAAEIGRGME